MSGELVKADETLKHLLDMQPDYAEDPREPVAYRGMPDELVEGLMTGPRKAGLDVPPVES